eukprot:gene7541-7751_t
MVSRTDNSTGVYLSSGKEDSVRSSVSKYYGETLQASTDLRTSACCTAKAPSAEVRELLARVPQDIVSRYYGCGSPFPVGLKNSALRVLDLGCGTGRDCYVCAALVGEEGFVTGIDMTPGQLEVAEKHQAAWQQQLGYSKQNMKFVQGEIEKLSAAGVAADSVDLIISNCVINLSADKAAVLQEAYQALAPGGELYFSDVYCDRRLPVDVRCHEVLLGECLGGALYINDFLHLAAQVGFVDPRVLEVEDVAVHDQELKELVGQAAFYSITIRLFKLPELLEPLPLEDYGQSVTYQGTLPGAPDCYILDRLHVFPKANRVKPLFRLDQPLLHQALFGLQHASEAQLQGICNRHLNSPWAGIVAQHIFAMSKRNLGQRPDQAYIIYTAQEGPAKGALNALSENPQDEPELDAMLPPMQALWIAAVMEQTASNAAVLAREADAQLALDGDSSKSKAVGAFLQQCVSTLGPARRPEEAARRRGNLTLLILLTRVYMWLNNVQGCSQVLKNFNANYSEAVLQNVPASYRVAAYYYLARTELNNDRIAEGLEKLEKAFRECKADSDNVKHILRVLIPYESFRQALQSGDVGLFDRSMQQHQLRLIVNGTLLLLEKLRFNVYRRLVQRCIDIAASDPQRTWQPHHLPLDVVLGVLLQQQVSTDMDGLECMLSNCVARRYFKGYISHKLKMLVLSKDDAFPAACEDWWREPQYAA